jgi:hypothetical protein
VEIRGKRRLINDRHANLQARRVNVTTPTGIKVEGEGEWNACKHDDRKRRVWRNIHIGINEQTL